MKCQSKTHLRNMTSSPDYSSSSTVLSTVAQRIFISYQMRLDCLRQLMQYRKQIQNSFCDAFHQKNKTVQEYEKVLSRSYKVNNLGIEKDEQIYKYFSEVKSDLKQMIYLYITLSNKVISYNEQLYKDMVQLKLGQSYIRWFLEKQIELKQQLQLLIFENNNNNKYFQPIIIILQFSKNTLISEQQQQYSSFSQNIHQFNNALSSQSNISNDLPSSSDPILSECDDALVQYSLQEQEAFSLFSYEGQNCNNNSNNCNTKNEQVRGKEKEQGHTIQVFRKRWQLYKPQFEAKGQIISSSLTSCKKRENKQVNFFHNKEENSNILTNFSKYITQQQQYKEISNTSSTINFKNILQQSASIREEANTPSNNINRQFKSQYEESYQKKHIFEQISKKYIKQKQKKQYLTVENKQKNIWEEYYSTSSASTIEEQNAFMITNEFKSYQNTSEKKQYIGKLYFSLLKANYSISQTIKSYFQSSKAANKIQKGAETNSEKEKQNNSLAKILERIDKDDFERKDEENREKLQINKRKASKAQARNKTIGEFILRQKKCITLDNSYEDIIVSGDSLTPNAMFQAEGTAKSFKNVIPLKFIKPSILNFNCSLSKKQQVKPIHSNEASARSMTAREKTRETNKIKLNESAQFFQESAKNFQILGDQIASTLQTPQKQEDKNFSQTSSVFDSLSSTPRILSKSSKQFSENQFQKCSSLAYNFSNKIVRMNTQQKQPLNKMLLICKSQTRFPVFLSLRKPIQDPFESSQIVNKLKVNNNQKVQEFLIPK